MCLIIEHSVFELVSFQMELKNDAEQDLTLK